MTPRPRPNVVQYVGYVMGRPLPAEMKEWVRNDLVGPGAAVRYVARFVVPVALVLLLFLLIPGPIWIPLAMMALLIIPLIYFAIALMNIYRRHRLAQHGLDPALVGERARARNESVRADYERRHGRG
ncbi:DUF5313 family protein [Rhodococcus sp. HNM0569]|uniref:DUF5313 family protein n=1 Tax=Rhodococcus sp. HNM0569 TaxID=2716340 RepID=UPI00146F72E9|nr:DUF5313 family protein [Rhodococcus sp. HNM0569]NLU85099.1 DUF5313 domain-containing protein [Rhodococcus sp. HNM0569]